jgi:hypothetical protein
MERRTGLAVALSAAGLVAVVVGVQQDLLAFRPMYDATIETGWGGPLNHEERLLGRVAAVGLLGAFASLRWRRAAVGPAVAGVVVGFYAARAVAYHAAEQALYTGLPLAGGETGRIVFGTEPYWLLLGATCLLAAGILGLRVGTAETSDPADSVSATSTEGAEARL